MNPNSPVPVIQPIVVAKALAKATRVRMVPWVRSSRRRNVAIPEVDGEAVKIFPTWLTEVRGFRARPNESLEPEPGAYSGSATPEPPISFGKSFNFGSPSFSLNAHS